MTIANNPIVSSTYVSNGTSQLITVPADIVKFEVFSETSYSGTNVSNTNMINAWWYKDLPADTGFVGNRTNMAHTIALTNMLPSGGFTLIDPTANQLQASITATGAGTINSAAPALLTTGNTGTLVAGDTVRLWTTTGLLQIAGIDYTVGTVTGNTSFTLKNLDTTLTNLTATATAATFAKLNYPAAYYPRRRSITNIGSSGTSSIITLSVTHGYIVGQQVRVYVPSAFGMTQINGLLGAITAIGASDASGFTNTITLNINSSAFTAFTWPTSATAAVGVLMPFVEPVGETATNSTAQPWGNLLDDRTVNTAAYQMSLGSSVVGASSDVIRWIAYRGLFQ